MKPGKSPILNTRSAFLAALGRGPDTSFRGDRHIRKGGESLEKGGLFSSEEADCTLPTLVVKIRGREQSHALESYVFPILDP